MSDPDTIPFSMTTHALALSAVLTAATFFVKSALAQESTPPFTAAEREAVYTASIEKRTADILQLLMLNNPDKSNRVHAAVISQYRALRARDEAIDTMFKALSKGADGIETNRTDVVRILSRQLHDRFIAKLSADLTPEEVGKVKDKMTYNKVQVTYDAYCAIVPGLTDKEKARILEVLKEAREEAMDGGSADEKSAIFQKYKDQINAYLNANGYDVAKAYRDWDAKQKLAEKQRGEPAAKAGQSGK